MKISRCGGIVLFALFICFPSLAEAAPMHGVRIVYFNEAGKVVGLDVQLCKPGGNGSNALTAGSVHSPYYRVDETVCSGSALRQVCDQDPGGGSIVCWHEAVDVGYGVYTASAALPSGMTLAHSYEVYVPGGQNYPEIWSVGIENVKRDILNGGGVWSDN